MNIKNYLICKGREIYYKFFERYKLKKEREIFENHYLYLRGINFDDTTPLISIYTPTYNRDIILMQRAIKSVLNQTYKNWEYIIVGDGCTDYTEEMVKSIGDPRIRFFNIERNKKKHPKNKKDDWCLNSVIPSNFALTQIRGKWIAHLDDDDIWYGKHLEISLRVAQHGDFEFVSGANREVRNKIVDVNHGNRVQSEFYTRKKKESIGYNPKIGAHSSYFYRSYLKVFKYNVHCWRKKWNSVNDIDLSLRMYNAGVRMGFIDVPMLTINPRPGDQTIGLEAILEND